MNQFYTHLIENDIAQLSQSESQHLKVLRKNLGDEIQIVDGNGKAYSGEILQMRKKDASVKIIKEIRESHSRSTLDIAIAPTKSNIRFEWFLEKATEIGVRNIYLIQSYHSERKVINKSRMEKIILSAMKQSLRLWMPTLHEIQSFEQLIHSNSFDQCDKFIPTTMSKGEHLKELIQSQHNTLVLIGPEGGFSEMEVDQAVHAGFKSVTLGESRLRTETAGIFVCSIFSNS